MGGQGGRRAGVLVAGLLAVLAIAVGIPLNVVSGYFPGTVTDHRLLWVGLLAGGVAMVVALTWLSQVLDDRKSQPLLAGQVPAAQGWVDRAELQEVVALLTARDTGPVALTTSLVGAGGFGKTMLAARACQDRTVLRRFGRGIVWVTVGRDADDARLATQISETIRVIGGSGPAFTNLEQAGQALANALTARGGRMLLVADDVWTARQLSPFAAAGHAARLMVTTRRPRIVDTYGPQRIEVDAVPDEVARQMLRRNLPSMTQEIERELVDLVGGWPLLAGLINRRLVADLAAGGEIEAAAWDASRRLRQGGRQALDVADEGSREDAVAATIEYSLETLKASSRDRFGELGIFPEDAEVPLAVVGLLWEGTAGLDSLETSKLCDQMESLSLVSLTWTDQVRVLVMHDVIRDYAGRCLDDGVQAAAHAALIRGARSLAEQDDPSHRKARGTRTAWWRLPDLGDYGYVWQYLTYHLEKAGMSEELGWLCGDLRFVASRLSRSGPAAIEADLARSGSEQAQQLRRVIAQNAHLLGAVEPPEALITVLTSRLGGLSEMSEQLPGLRSEFHTWTAWPVWPPPDQPIDAQLRTLPGHRGGATAVAIAPDGSWLATGSVDGTVRIWSAAGTPLRTLLGHQGQVTAVAIAPDGSWLATASNDETVRIWSADGTMLRTLGWKHSVLLKPLPESERAARAVGIGPDGSWLVIGGADKSVRIWSADGRPLRTVYGHWGQVTSIAVAPDGSWLATGSTDGTVRIWSARGVFLRSLPLDYSIPATSMVGTMPPINAVAVAPDGSWLATGSATGAVKIWSLDGSQLHTLLGHKGEVIAIAVAPDGSWLATGSSDGTVRMWSADGKFLRTFSEHRSEVCAAAVAPDGSWLATGSSDGMVRMWSANFAPSASSPNEHKGVMTALSMAPDGSWLATGSSRVSDDGLVRTWTPDGEPLRVFTKHREDVRAMTIAPDGSWLATVGAGGAVLMWTPSGRLLGTFGKNTRNVAVSPDGSWLATGAASDEGMMQVWSPRGELLRTFGGDRYDTVTAMAVAPDGSWLATASARFGSNRTLQMWTPRGRLLRTLGKDKDRDSIVTAMVVAPDGSWLAVGSADGKVQMWSPEGKSLGTFGNDTGMVQAMAVSQDGCLLAVGSTDGTVGIWDVADQSNKSLSAVRVDGSVSACILSGVQQNLSLYIAGSTGLYKFTLCPSKALRCGPCQDSIRALPTASYEGSQFLAQPVCKRTASLNAAALALLSANRRWARIEIRLPRRPLWRIFVRYIFAGKQPNLRSLLVMNAVTIRSQCEVFLVRWGGSGHGVSPGGSAR